MPKDAVRNSNEASGAMLVPSHAFGRMFTPPRFSAFRGQAVARAGTWARTRHTTPRRRPPGTRTSSRRASRSRAQPFSRIPAHKELSGTILLMCRKFDGEFASLYSQQFSLIPAQKEVYGAILLMLSAFDGEFAS